MNSTQSIELEDLKYHVFPSKRLGPCEYSNVHDQAFNFWVKVWTEAFSNAKPSEGWEDHFHKQDIITAITYQGEVVAAHLYTFYDLKASSTKASEYFSFISQETQKLMLDTGYINVMSMEYLSVSSAVKRNSLKVSFGKMILGLGGYLAENKGLDAAIGTPVFGNKVDDMMKNVGGYVVQQNFKKYGFDVDLLLIPSNPCSRSLDEHAGKIMEHLWNTRNDFTLGYYARLAA